jgi:hypothetical protein
LPAIQQRRARTWMAKNQQSGFAGARRLHLPSHYVHSCRRPLFKLWWLLRSSSRFTWCSRAVNRTSLPSRSLSHTVRILHAKDADNHEPLNQRTYRENRGAGRSDSLHIRSFALGPEDCDVAFDIGVDSFTGAFLAAPEDGRDSTTVFAFSTAAFAS